MATSSPRRVYPILEDFDDQFKRCKHCRKWYIPFVDKGSDDHFCSLKCRALHRDEDSRYDSEEQT